MENSPVGSSGSNGIIERAIQAVEEQARVMRCALEKRWGVVVPGVHAIWTWLFEYAGLLLNRMEVSRDGLTSYERSKGKKAKELEYEFSEGVWWRTKVVKTTMKKLEIMWQDGVFLGVKATTGEMIVGTAEGIFRTRTLRKKPKEDRWDVKHMDMIGGVPWRTRDGDESTTARNYRRSLSLIEQKGSSQRKRKRTYRRNKPRRALRSRKTIWMSMGTRKAARVARRSSEGTARKRTLQDAGRDWRRK